MRSPFAERVRAASPCGVRVPPLPLGKRSGQMRDLSRKQVGVARPLWVRVPPLPPRRGRPTARRRALDPETGVRLPVAVPRCQIVSPVGRRIVTPTAGVRALLWQLITDDVVVVQRRGCEHTPGRPRRGPPHAAPGPQRHAQGEGRVPPPTPRRRGPDGRTLGPYPRSSGFDSRRRLCLLDAKNEGSFTCHVNARKGVHLRSPGSRADHRTRRVGSSGRRACLDTQAGRRFDSSRVDGGRS